MEVRFDVKMTQKVMYNFLMSHTYKTFSGVAGILFGIAAIILAIVMHKDIENSTTVILVAFGVLFLVYTPYSLFIRSAKQVKLNPVFKKPITYVVNEGGIITMQDQQKAEVPWADIVKVEQTKVSLLIYTSPRHSFIWPKESIGEQYYEALVQMIKDHVETKKVRIKE